MGPGHPACASPTKRPPPPQCWILPGAEGTSRGHPSELLGHAMGQCHAVGQCRAVPQGTASSQEPWELFVTDLTWKCPFFPWAVASLPASQQ